MMELWSSLSPVGEHGADRERVKADFLLLCAITRASGVLLKRDTHPL